MDQRVRLTDRHRFRSYWKKAEELHSQMEHAQKEEKWNAASVNAIHCAISVCDAVCTYSKTGK